MASPKDTAAIATYGDHEVIMPENKLRKAVSDRPLEPGEGRSGRARRKGAGRTVGRIRLLDGRPNASGSTRRAIGFARRLHRGQQGSAVPRRPRHQGRSRDLRLSGGGIRGADSLCRLIEHTPDVDPHSDQAGRPARRRGARDLSRICALRRRGSGDHADQAAARGDRRIPDARESRPAGRARADHGPSIVPE